LGVGAVKKVGIFFFGEGFASVAARVPRCGTQGRSKILLLLLACAAGAQGLVLGNPRCCRGEPKVPTKPHAAEFEKMSDEMSDG